MEKIVILSGKRTPFGSFGGSLKDLSATDLGVAAARGTLDDVSLKPEQIDHIVFGNVVQADPDAIYSPRHIGLKLGIPQSAGALGVNRLCGSGFQSWITAAQMLMTGEAQCILAGGTEQMSRVPYVARGVRFGGIRMGHGELEDYLTAALTDSYAQIPMAITAENLGDKYNLTRDQVDNFSYNSQQKYKQALDKGAITDEITPLTIKTRKGDLVIEKDEHPKPDVTLEKIKSMKSIFKKDGFVTAATASGIVDGAAASLLTTESHAKKLGITPKAKIVSWASVGCDPSIMGIGPVEACRKALKNANLSFKDMDLIEVNEAFAAQFLAVEKELQLDPKRTNVNGGAIAVGHPLGATGTRIMNLLMLELERVQGRYAIGSACIGGGQGIAIIIERVTA